MARTKIMKSAGRFGVRYGQSARRRTSDVEAKQKKKQKCPFCGGRARRNSKGIWNCQRCGKRFAGHAYFLEQLESSSKTKAEQRIELKAENTENRENAEKTKAKNLKKEKSTK